MYRSPSYQTVSVYRSPSHQALGVSRSTSRLAIDRSSSFGGFQPAQPIGRSPSSIFGRTLHRSAHHLAPPLHSVAVQRSTPHYSDKYPYVRYSYGSADAGLGIIAQTATAPRYDYTQRYRTTKQYLDGSFSMYGTNRHLTPSYGSGSSYSSRPRASHRTYVRYLPVDDAIDMYKNRYMTTSTLSKYWLTPSTWVSRREKEWKLSQSVSSGKYSYASRYTPLSYY